jgi:RsiW-degrading membrane proteinase PrsW (M82 family)
MLNIWPSLTLLLLVALFWFEFRPLGGGATLGFGRFLLYFLLGCVGSSVFTIVLQRFAILFFDLKTVSWSFGPPIEELTKAAPVLLLIYYFKLGRPFTIADMTLIALACGLGFAFMEEIMDI